jgi:hypothetical protein
MISTDIFLYTNVLKALLPQCLRGRQNDEWENIKWIFFACVHNFEILYNYIYINTH